MKLSQSFHNTIDANARAYQLYTPGGWISNPIYITFKERSLTYQFFPHFHPYVAGNRAFVPNMKLSLIERLREGDLLSCKIPTPSICPSRILRLVSRYNR